MVQLRVLEILQEQGRTKYWLFKNIGISSYTNFDRMIKNQTKSIEYQWLDKMSTVLDVPVGELFEQTSDRAED
jgi:DNA-binding Xre family transcriptional regulator